MKNNSVKQGLGSILVFLIFAFSTGASSAQSRRVADLTALIERNADWNPAHFILDKLETNRIVMVGDAHHGDPLYSRVVVNSLNDWVTQWARMGSRKNAGRLPSKLFLILEMDSVQAKALRQYFRSGDPVRAIEPFYFIGYQITTGVLEFYNDLRLIRQRVDSLNEHRAAKDRIFFDVVGKEEIIDHAKWTPELRDSLFVYRRDQYSSSGIEKLLTASPGAKALVYIGEMHLFKREWVKSAGKWRVNGYYLAHYLEQYFGAKGGVYACEQIDVHAVSKRMDKAIIKIGKTFAIDGSVFRGVAVGINAYVPWMDGAIFYFTVPRHTRELSMLYSENLVDYILKNIDSYRNTSEVYNKWVMMSWFYYLSGVAAVPSPAINYGDSTSVDSAITAWKEWRRSTRLNIVGGIAGLEYFKKYLDLVRNTSGVVSTEYEQHLASLVGFRDWFPMGTPVDVRADSMWGHIKRYRKSVITENLVYLLWIASKSEKAKAIHVLEKETGMHFKTAQAWTSWWETQQSK